MSLARVLSTGQNTGTYKTEQQPTALWICVPQAHIFRGKTMSSIYLLTWPTCLSQPPDNAAVREREMDPWVSNCTDRKAYEDIQRMLLGDNVIILRIESARSPLKSRQSKHFAHSTRRDKECLAYEPQHGPKDGEVYHEVRAVWSGLYSSTTQ